MERPPNAQGGLSSCPASGDRPGPPRRSARTPGLLLAGAAGPRENAPLDPEDPPAPGRTARSRSTVSIETVGWLSTPVGMSGHDTPDAVDECRNFNGNQSSDFH
ncbi:hypothetical protein E1288_00295 [Saccharopolyspora elongata]|uniref:Uncharacterized protein n=1 Tax=Saccharopolyspora elongata TaxID=2530387 RepID=A0A4R4ZDN0_9PSEU|nr:hypothetical protein E1288_00295 [Saccharopolyspora elongata]